MRSLHTSGHDPRDLPIAPTPADRGPGPGGRRLASAVARLQRPGLALGLILLLGLAGCASAPRAPLPTVAAVDLARYAGTWYEVAKLPNRFQSVCASDTQAHYRLEGERVRVVNRCRRSDGRLTEIQGSARVVPGSGNARLEVTFFWPFAGDYWVLALDPDYRQVLVGEPGRAYAWVLSRTPDPGAEVIDRYLAQAERLGFDRSAFTRTESRQPIPPLVD